MRRLVDEEHGRRHQERPGKRQTLLHPVGVLADALLGDALQTDVREHGTCASQRLPTPQAVEASEEDEILERRDPEVERSVAGRRESDPLAEGTSAGTRIEPRNLHRSFARGQQPGQDPDERRLAGAVRAEQRVDLAAADRDRDVVQHRALRDSDA